MIKPLNNMCLIEVIDEFDGIIRNSADEQVQKGVLRAAEFVECHLTASTGYTIPKLQEHADAFTKLVGKVVYWEQYADTGKQFDIAGKRYTLVPFYRLIGFDDETTKGSK